MLLSLLTTGIHQKKFLLTVPLVVRLVVPLEMPRRLEAFLSSARKQAVYLIG